MGYDKNTIEGLDLLKITKFYRHLPKSTQNLSLLLKSWVTSEPLTQYIYNYVSKKKISPVEL